MNYHDEDPQPRMDAKRRRFLLAIALLGFVVWVGFLWAQRGREHPIPKAGPEMRILAQRHLRTEALDSFASPERANVDPQGERR